MHEGLREESGLLDRLKFFAITSSNYDEFFMVRIARLMRDKEDGDLPFPATGMRPSEILEVLLGDIRKVVEKQDQVMAREIIPALARQGLVLTSPENWGPEEKRQADEIFENELSAMATPIAITDHGTLDSLISRNRIYVAFLLNGDDLAVVRTPGNIDRFREFRIQGDGRQILLLEDILKNRGERFFEGRELKSACFFRVTRDADMTVDEERDQDFIEAMEEILESRKEGFPVRLETRGDRSLAGLIRHALNLPEANHFHFDSPLDHKGFFHFASLAGFEHLRTSLPSPKPAEDISDTDDIWEVLRERDVLLHHPYETYRPVIRLVEEAADSPGTLAIKMTLYRTSGDSPIVKALIRAAERGVQVTVLVELKARFSEGANINWASRLEKAGAIVIYGLAVLKVHAKALMIVRREDGGIRRYLHLGTGNYNDSTAKLYTDISLITGRGEYTRDAALIFNAITGYSSEPHLETLYMAPFTLRPKTLRLIHREEKRARAGEDARIVAKMNSLVDDEIIEALYRASCAGVAIDLNVRGTCCLRPGVKGLSENIRVVSVIDGFLEHTRAFMYQNGGRQEIFLSSADWMTRNLDGRVELLFPVNETGHKIRIRSILESYFRDNSRSWELRPEGDWIARVPEAGEAPFRVQKHFAEKVAADAASRLLEERKSFKVRRVPPGGR
jgi:polyphosphate kinase